MLRSFLVMGTSIITSTLTAEAGIAVCTTIQASAEAGITRVTDTLHRRVDMLMVSTAVAVEEQFMAAASPVAVAASMAAVVDLAAEGTVTKDERLGYELC